MKNNLLFFLAIFVIILLSSCRKEPDTPVNEEELITTMILSLQKNGSATLQNFVWNDPDGVGGIVATIDSIIIDKAAEYNATITLLNTQESPADTISKEVLEEGINHQFFYESTPSTVLSGFNYLVPNDDNGNPIGLLFDFDTWNWEISGMLKIILRHEPIKTASGVASGDITNADGETDLEVEFPVRLK